MEIIYKAHTSHRKKPQNLIEQDLPLFKHELEKTIHQTHAVILKNVFLLKDSIFKPSRLKFYPSYTHIFSLRKKERIKRALLLKQKKVAIEKAIWIVDEGSYGYFHWLTDALPRLMAVVKYRYPVVLPQYLEKYSFVKASLELLGHESIFFPPEIPAKVKELVVPSHTAPSGNFNKELLQKLRDKFLERITLSKPERKIYISRKKAPKRHIINEDELQEFLKKEGFEVHYFEDHSFKQQLELVSSCKCLAGLHGAGLTNMLFMQKGTQLLELRNQNDAHNNCYFSMASDLDIDYYYLLNQGTNNDTHTVDVTVDLKALKKVLDVINIS